MFRGRYLSNIPSGFVWQDTPLQVYPLSHMSDYFQLPTPLLRTDYDFLIYVLKGTFTLQIGTSKVRVTGPGVVYVSAGTIVSMESIEEKMQGYFVLMEEKIMSALFKEHTSLGLFNIHPVLEVDDQSSDWMYRACQLLYAEISRESTNPEVAHGLFQAIMHKVLENSDKVKYLDRTHQIAVRFKQLAHRYFKESKHTPFYADKLSISENYLNRCVNKVFHKGVKDMVLEISILHSQLLLFDFSKSIAQVCFEVDFNDPAYFSRLFRKVTGMTPTQYREKIMHGLS